MHWDKKLLKNLNINIPLIVILLIALGFITISSAVEINNPEGFGKIYLQKQAVSIILGIIFIIVLQFVDYRLFKHYADMIYISTVSILVILLIIGQTVAGGKRWIELGPLNFQPSELAKIAFILVLASVLDNKSDDLEYLTGFIKPFTYFLVLFMLIILQNDLGTALVLLVIFIVMLYAAGANTRFMIIIFGGTFAFLVLLILLHIYLGLPLPYFQDYQLNRLIVFVNPGVDPYGIGYNIIQSKIAVGSGKLMGKGLFEGTQNQLNFLPEKHTDFIFSVLGEEFGFLGVLALLLLYLFLLWEILQIARQAKDNYGSLVTVGIAAMFLFHIIENIGMTMGVMPITGIPLPFISYGGTYMVISLIAIGLVININLRKKKILF